MCCWARCCRAFVDPAQYLLFPEIRTQFLQKFVTGTHKGRGSGLDLAVCKQAVEPRGQQIWVVTLSGQGIVPTLTIMVALDLARSSSMPTPRTLPG